MLFLLASAVRGLNGWSEQNKGFFDKLVLDWTPDDQKWKVRVEQSADVGPLRGSTGWVLPKFDPKDKVSVDEYAKSIVRVYKDQLSKGGPAAGEAFLEGLKSVDMPTPILDQLKSRFGPDLDQELNSRGRAGGGSLTRGLASGMDESTEPSASVGRLRASLGTFTMDANTWLTPAGQATMDGFKTGSENQQPGIAGWFASLGTPFGDAMAGAASWLLGRGGDAMGGFKSGAEGGTEATKGVFSGLNSGLTNATSGSNQWLNSRGGDAMGGFKSGAEGRRGEVGGVFGALVGIVTSAVPNPFGLLWGAGSSIMSGFLSGLRSAYEGVKTFISGIAGWIRDNKGPEAYDRKLLVPAGGWIMDGFQRGLERGFGRVQSRVAGMASAIRDQFSAGLSGDVAAGIDLSADAARSIAASAKAKAEQDALARSTQGAGSKTYVLQGLTTRETAEEIAEEIDKKERRSIARTGALPTTEVT